MLTIGCAKAALASWASVRIAAAATFSVISLVAARADGIGVGGCIGDPRSVNCVVRWGEAGDPYVRHVPQAEAEQEKDRAAARDRRWQERCRPVITQDGYGVPRYHYAAPGCEFGVIE